MEYVLFLNEAEKLNLGEAGGKASNLAILISSELPVPQGFCLTTKAYRTFVGYNNLRGKIEEQLASIKDVADLGELERVSSKIMEFFEGATIPKDIETEIIDSYKSLMLSIEKINIVRAIQRTIYTFCLWL